MSAATTNTRLILVAALAALGAETISMGAVAFTSTRSRWRLYVSEVDRERREMVDVPDTERDEVRTVLAEWGYSGATLDEMTHRICENPKAWLEFMMAFELKLAPVKEDQARKSAYVVGAATLAGSIVPLIPYLIPGLAIRTSLIAAVVLSAIALGLIGSYEARITDGKPFRNAAQMILIGLSAGFAGFLIGYIVGAP